LSDTLGVEFGTDLGGCFRLPSTARSAALSAALSGTTLAADTVHDRD
jgi:hypothetical protein